jgi:hypothetical protein
MANAQLRPHGDAPEVSEIEYPRVDLRAIPSFRCSCPPEWIAAEGPGALVVMRPPSHGSSAHAVDATIAELRVEGVRVAAGTRLADLAAANLVRRRRVAPDLAVVTQKLGRFGTIPAHLCGAAWTTPDGGRAAQLQVVIFAPDPAGAADRTVVDALILTGTCAEADAPTLVPEYVRIAASIRFDAAETSAGAGPSARPVGSVAAVARDDVDPFTTTP